MSHRGLTWVGDGLRRATVYRAYARRRQPQARRMLQQLRTMERSGGEQIAAEQLQRLQSLLDWASRASPHYREQAQACGYRPGSVRHLEDLSQWPVLTKATLRREGARMLAGGAVQPGWQANASGGSTGEPVRLHQDRNYWNESQAAQWLIEGWWGLRPGEACAVFWGADRDLEERGWMEKLGDAICQTRYCNAFRMDEAELQRFTGMLSRWQPAYISGYATALDLAARYLLQQGRAGEIRPRAVKSAAEVLRPQERERISRAFAAPVYDFYGSREINVLASECPAHAGLHVNCWGRVIELVDGCGRAVPPGVPGQVLVTDLTNRATPMIRYENGDIGEWGKAPCPCGRPYPLLARIAGRKSDFIRTPDGRLIHGEYFTHLFYEQRGVRSFQVVQETLERLQVQVVLDGCEVGELAAQLEPRIAEVMGPLVRIEFERMSALPRGASGKHAFTRSSLELPWPEQPGEDPRQERARQA